MKSLLAPALLCLTRVSLCLAFHSSYNALHHAPRHNTVALSFESPCWRQQHQGRNQVTASGLRRRQRGITTGGANRLTLSALPPSTLRLVEILAPKIGILTATALYFAPAAAVLKAVRTNEVGDLNPFPLAMMSVVSVGWLAYGLVARDPHVALSNIFGCIGSIGYIVGILPLLSNDKERLRMTQSVIIAGGTATLGLWTFLGLAGCSRDAISSALGTFASGLFVVLSGSPLSSIKAVIAKRDSSTILGPLTAAQVANTALWTSYGFLVQNRFIWGPNSVGLGLGLVQLVLKVLFPVKKELSVRRNQIMPAISLLLLDNASVCLGSPSSNDSNPAI